MISVSLCPFQHESATCRNKAATSESRIAGLWGGNGTTKWVYGTLASSRSLIFTILWPIVTPLQTDVVFHLLWIGMLESPHSHLFLKRKRPIRIRLCIVQEHLHREIDPDYSVRYP